MAQMTIYLPDILEKDLKQRAKKMRKSISAYLAELVRKNSRSTKWPQSFDKLYGSWQGKFPDIEDLKMERIEDL